VGRGKGEGEVRIMIWLYVTAVITTIIAIAGWVINKEATLWFKVMIVFLVVVALIAQCFIIWGQQKEKEVTRYAGVLEGKPITILSASQQAYPKLQLGNSKSILVWQGPQGEPIMEVFDESGITIWVEKNAIKVSTKIRNSKGELIAELIGNEWKVKSGKIWDRNYRENALEIIGEAGDVILQVMLEEDVLRFAAKMYGSAGQGVGLGSAEDPKLGVVGVIEVRPPGQPLELVIEPIFKYPSELHLGELK